MAIPSPTAIFMKLRTKDVTIVELKTRIAELETENEALRFDLKLRDEG